MGKYLKQHNTDRAFGNSDRPSAEEIEEQHVNDGNPTTKELADLPEDKEWKCEESDGESSSFPSGVKESDDKEECESHEKESIDKEKSGLREKERNDKEKSASHDQRNSSEKNCIPQINTSDLALWPVILNSANTDHTILNSLDKTEDMTFPVNEQKQHFSKSHGERVLEDGEKLNCLWLVYSKSTDKVFWFCCKIFYKNAKSLLALSGYNYWHNLADALQHKKKNHIAIFLPTQMDGGRVQAQAE